MLIALGKLARFKRLLNTTNSTLDDELRGYLLQATAMAKHGELAGRDLTRQRHRVEIHPAGSRGLRTQRLLLSRFPVETVTEVVAPGIQSTAADFDAYVTAGNAMVEGTDYRVGLDRGELIRHLGYWPFDQRDSVRVTYTAGFADLAVLDATINADDNTQLDVSTGFAEPGTAGSVADGDEIWFNGGSLTGLGDGRHAVYIHDVAGVATLASVSGADFPDQGTTAHTPIALVTVAGGANAITDVQDHRPWPIADRALQEACVKQAHLLYQTRDTAGVSQVNVGSGAGGGSYTPTGEPIEPSFQAACRALKRWSV